MGRFLKSVREAQVPTAAAANQYLQDAQARGLSPGTIRTLNSVLGRFAQIFEIVPFAPSQIEDFLRLSATLGTRKTYRRLLNGFYSFVCQNGLPNPIPRVKVPERAIKQNKRDRLLGISYPQGQGSYPQGQGSYPQPSYPQPSYPQPSYPQPSYPQPSYPQEEKITAHPHRPAPPSPPPPLSSHLIVQNAEQGSQSTSAASELFLASRRAMGCSERTMETYTRTLHRFADHFDTLPTGPQEIEQYIDAIPGSQENRHFHFRPLRTLYNFVCAQCGTRFPRQKKGKGVDRCDNCGFKNPFLFISAPILKKKLPKGLSEDEITALLSVIEKPEVQERDRVMIYCLLDTGIRAGEIVSLRFEDIEDQHIRIQGKTGEHRPAISPWVRDMLLGLGHDGYVFKPRLGEKFTAWGISEVVRPYMKQAGITGKKLGPHTLRHTVGRFGSRDLIALQKQLGHTNIATTRRYAEIGDSEVSQRHISPVAGLGKKRQPGPEDYTGPLVVPEDDHKKGRQRKGPAPEQLRLGA